MATQTTLHLADGLGDNTNTHTSSNNNDDTTGRLTRIGGARSFGCTAIFERDKVLQERKQVMKALRMEPLIEYLECYVQTRRAIFGLLLRCILAAFVAAFFVAVVSQTTNRGLEVVIGNFVQQIAKGSDEVDGWESLNKCLQALVRNLFDPHDASEEAFIRVGSYNVFLGMTLTVWPGQTPTKVPFGSELFPYKTADCLDTAMHGCVEPPLEMWQLGHHSLEGAPVRYRGSGLPTSYAPRCDGSQPYGEYDLFNQPDFDRLSHVGGWETNTKPHKSFRSGPHQPSPPPGRELGHANLTNVLEDLEWMLNSKWINDNHTSVTALFFFYNTAQGYTAAVSTEWIVRDRDMTVDVEVLDQDGAFQFVSHRYSASFCDMSKEKSNILKYFPSICMILFILDIALTAWEFRRVLICSKLRQKWLAAGCKKNKSRNPFKRFLQYLVPGDLSPPTRCLFGLTFQIVFFISFLDTLHNANFFFESSSGAGDACADDATVLADCDALPPSCGVHPCEGLTDSDRLECCRRGMAYDSAYSVVSISRTRHWIVVKSSFLIIFLFCSILSLFPQQNRLGLLYTTMKLSMQHLVHYIIGLVIVIVGFGVAGTILFSHGVDGFGSASSSMGKLTAMLISGDLNTENFESAYALNNLVAVGFYILFGLISILILANIFIAIVCEGYIESNELFDDLRSQCTLMDVKDTLAYCPIRKMFSKCPSHKVNHKECYVQCLTAMKELEQESQNRGREASTNEKWDELRNAVKSCQYGCTLNDRQADRVLCRILRLPRSPQCADAIIKYSSRREGMAASQKTFATSQKAFSRRPPPTKTRSTRSTIPETDMDTSSGDFQESQPQAAAAAARGLVRRESESSYGVPILRSDSLERMEDDTVGLTKTNSSSSPRDADRDNNNNDDDDDRSVKPSKANPLDVVGFWY